MKIIKQGKLESNKLRGECRTCGCVIEANKSECTREHSMMSTKMYYEKKCPTKNCDGSTWMSQPPWNFSADKRVPEAKIRMRIEAIESVMTGGKKFPKHF